MSKIKNIVAREIRDSRGNPTVEVTVETDKDSLVASVPSGASTGKNEALELRDADEKGVQKAISNVNDIIALKLKEKNPENQKEIDELIIALDGTENKSKLGANAILGVSMAVCRAGAGAKKIPLYSHIFELSTGRSYPPTRRSEVVMPLAMFNLIEGGRHAKNDLDIQEFMVVPQKETFTENFALCNKIFQNLNELIKENYGSAEMGDEGGFAPKILKTEQALFLLKNAIGNERAKIALDCAASEFYKNPSAGSEQVGKYNLDGKEFTRMELAEFYDDLIKRFPIVSTEDPFDEEDWNGFESFMSSPVVRTTGLIVIGDDLTTTNIKRIKEARNKNACNAVILKLNQIGTVSETIEASNLAKSFGWKTIVSHRSGETMDDFIADLAVGAGADFIKSGSPAKPERMVKYKRMIEIEDKLRK